jgi:hypothetical protein
MGCGLTCIPGFQAAAVADHDAVALIQAAQDFDVGGGLDTGCDVPLLQGVIGMDQIDGGLAARLIDGLQAAAPGRRSCAPA